MKDVLTSLIKTLVDNPDSVVVDEQEADGMTQFTVTVAKDDMGKIIGKEGKVIRALRNVMKIKAFRLNKKVNIALTETPVEL